MTDRRRHRGAHPEDARLFAPQALPTLIRGVAEFSWLLSRGYAGRSALTLVGDRYQLEARQRLAVMRCACSDEARDARGVRRVEPPALRGRRLVIDGFNVLTTLESALGGGVLLIGRDGAMRDLASMHGSYRKVQETTGALEFIGGCLAEIGVVSATWLLDAPVSNSGRLKQVMAELAGRRGWAWDVQVVANPDVPLAASDEIIATADSVVLDGCGRWLNLARHVVAAAAPGAWVVDLAEA